MITFTVDVEDPTGQYAPDGRYIGLTRHILDMCSELHRRATFFVVGKVAEAAPDLIKDIASRGHEVAYHSHAHVPLTKEQPLRFHRETAADKDKIEQLTGKNLIGFRAPCFSLTRQTLWAIDSLGRLGFKYSSSIMPTAISLFGFSGASTTPFRWPNGMIELPLPVTGASRLPYLGGVYLYVLPAKLVNYFVTRANSGEILWTYTHPYDFDRGEKFEKMADTPLWMSTILWAARRDAADKVKQVLTLGDAPPLCERLPDQGLTTFNG